jgi:hypothetical protein
MMRVIFQPELPDFQRLHFFEGLFEGLLEGFSRYGGRHAAIDGQ